MTKRLTKKQKKDNLAKRRFLRTCKKYGMQGQVIKTIFGDFHLIGDGYIIQEMDKKIPSLSDTCDNRFKQLCDRFALTGE